MRVAFNNCICCNGKLWICAKESGTITEDVLSCCCGLRFTDWYCHCCVSDVVCEVKWDGRCNPVVPLGWGHALSSFLHFLSLWSLESVSSHMGHLPLYVSRYFAFMSEVIFFPVMKGSRMPLSLVVLVLSALFCI